MPRQYSPRVPIVCETCQQTFYVIQARTQTARFCSRTCKHAGLARPLAERFWEKVDTSGECWEWTANRYSAGYGQFSASSGHPSLAHRIAWELTNGSIPDGMHVCHNCPGGDNPACVNPAHLFLGTAADNSADMVRKARSARGEGHPSVRLTETDVRRIRALSANGVPFVAIAVQFGVGHTTILNVAHRRTWRHIL